MTGLEQYIFELLLSYASEPTTVYLLIVVLMTAGSFGLPVSEEVILISAGLLAYVGSHPELFPVEGLSDSYVTVPIAATVCFLSVFFSDILVYSLGRFWSDSILKSKLFHRLVSKKNLDKISRIVLRYRFFYPAVFRFIPGLRFPGHFSSGMFRIPFYQFFSVVGVAALLTVPTQVFLIGYFGESIVKYLQEFALIMAGIMLIFIGIFTYKVIRSFRKEKEADEAESSTTEME